MSAGEILLWIILPYVAIATFVVGHWWRYRFDQFGWTSGSTQLFEQKILGWAGPAFHYGALAAVGGHVIGLMIPKSFTEAIGMSESTYRWFSAVAGAVAGAVCVVGFVGLVYRRATNVAGPPHDLAHRSARLPAAGRADRPRLLDDVRAQPDHERRRTTTASRSRSGGARCSSCSPTSRPSRTRTPSTRCTRSSPGGSGRCSRSAAWCTPGASRCSTSGARTSSTGAATLTPSRAAMTRRRAEPGRSSSRSPPLAFMVVLLRVERCSGRSARTCRTSIGAVGLARPRRWSPCRCCWAR